MFGLNAISSHVLWGVAVSSTDWNPVACLNCIPFQPIIKSAWRRQEGVFEHLLLATQHSLFPFGLYSPVGETCRPVENEESNNQVSGEFSGHSAGRVLTVGWQRQMSNMDRIQINGGKEGEIGYKINSWQQNDPNMGLMQTSWEWESFDNTLVWAHLDLSNILDTEDAVVDMIQLVASWSSHFARQKR